jgi:hypothetical protein
MAILYTPDRVPLLEGAFSLSYRALSEQGVVPRLLNLSSFPALLSMQILCPKI